MKHFKDAAGNPFAYDDEQIAMGLADGKVEMTEAEVEALTNPVKTEEQLAEERKAEIKHRLQTVDAESIRPLRALLTAPDSEFDLKKIADLDAEAAALRLELSKLK